MDGGHRHAGGLHPPPKRLRVGPGLAAVLVGHRPGPLRITIDNADQADAVESRVQPRVMTSQVTDPDDPDLNLARCHGYRQTPRSLERTNSTK